MIEIVAIDHIVLRTERLQEMVRFYCEVLNCSLERELPASVGLTQLRAGNALIDLVPVDSELGRMGGAAPGSEGRNLDHFCLQIQPLDEEALLRELDAAGVNAGEFAERYGAEGFGRSLYISDPEGNVVELRMAQNR